MGVETDGKKFIFRSYVNSFHYLYQDAEYFLNVAQSESTKDSFQRTQFSRTAILLFIFSLEGLINRAMDHFLPKHLHEFFIGRENRFSLEKKFQLFPILMSAGELDRSRYPWSHFKELVKLRNDFVHPKYNRPAYYRAISLDIWDTLQWNQIPKELDVKEDEVVYRNTQIPRDPHAILPEHAEKVKKIVDDMLVELDQILGGKIFENNWCHNDQMKLIYPPGATPSDIPVKNTP